jgi:hypothetical protein
VFCAEHRQRDSEAQVGERYDPVETASPSDIVSRSEQSDYEQREACGGHPEGGGGEYWQIVFCTEAKCLMGSQNTLLTFTMHGNMLAKLAT